MLALYLLAAALFGAAIGVIAGRHRWRNPLDYPTARLDAILLVADQLPKGGTLLLGDSLLEHCHFAEPDIINAGAAYATIAHVAAIAPKLIAATRPRTVLLAIGANDLQNGATDFARDYASLARQCDAPRLVLAGIPNREEPNALIAKLANEIGAEYLPPIFGDGLTFDHMGHQTPAGREAFKRRIRDAIAEPSSLKACG